MLVKSVANILCVFLIITGKTNSPQRSTVITIHVNTSILKQDPSDTKPT